MADDQSDLKKIKPIEKQLLASFVEMLSSDGVVLLHTWTKNNQTKARMATWGNGLLCKSLLEWAYSETFADEDIEDLEGIDEEDNEEGTEE